MDTINNIIEDDMEDMHEINVHAEYPKSEDYIYTCSIKRINLDKEKVKKIDGVLGTVSEKIKELSNKSKSNAKTDKGILGTFLGELGNLFSW